VICAPTYDGKPLCLSHSARYRVSDSAVFGTTVPGLTWLVYVAVEDSHLATGFLPASRTRSKSSLEV
jgi:hypothetical protein